MSLSDKAEGGASTLGAGAAGGEAPRDYGIAPSGYRLPPATTLGRVRLQIADLARSIDYYETAIGLRVVERSAGTAILAPIGGDNPVVELHERKGASPVPRRGRLGLYHFAILLPDRPALGRFLTHLAKLGIPAGTSDHFVSEAVYLTDPDGLGIEVYADRARSLWRYEGRQLAMATEPLDARSVIASSGGTPWTGAPEGTVLGHVHLHVGNLEQAADFYHGALGFDKTVWSYPGALFMSAGGYHHHLGTNIWAAHAGRAEAGDARLLEWEILLPGADVDRAAGSLEAAGHAVERGEGSVAAWDPWGTGVRLVVAG